MVSHMVKAKDRGIEGSHDPDLPLDMGSSIRSRSLFEFGIGSDRNRSEVIEIDRDREKIVVLQCTEKRLPNNVDFCILKIWQIF